MGLLFIGGKTMTTLAEQKEINEKEAEDLAAAAAAEALKNKEPSKPSSGEEPKPGEGDTPKPGEGDKPELWMETGDKAPGSKVVPLAAHIHQRHKMRGTIADQATELETLKAENAQLRRGQPQQPAPNLQADKPPKMPLIEDFDLDATKYAAAMTEWHGDMATHTAKRLHAEDTVTAKQTERTATVNAAVDGHYERAATLSEASGITAEDYQAADTIVRTTFEQLIPGKGEALADEMISRLGEGSEKVMFYLGRNPEELAAVKAVFASDTTGLSLAMHLGSLNSRLATPIKPESLAPAPDTQLKGDVTPGNAAAVKKDYDAAHTAGNGQKALTLKRAAKKAGIDTSNW
jgi:hypothetical protein